MLARLNRLIAILADAHIGVLGAGGFRGIERAHCELFEGWIGEWRGGRSGDAVLRGETIRREAKRRGRGQLQELST